MPMNIDTDKEFDIEDLQYDIEDSRETDRWSDAPAEIKELFHQIEWNIIDGEHDGTTDLIKPALQAEISARTLPDLYMPDANFLSLLSSVVTSRVVLPPCSVLTMLVRSKIRPVVSSLLILAGCTTIAAIGSSLEFATEKAVVSNPTESKSIALCFILALLLQFVH